VKTPYVVTYESSAISRHATFADALNHYTAACEKYGSGVIGMHNADDCDVDSDGLTEDERDQVLEAS
jgi:hypothetical protein